MLDVKAFRKAGYAAIDAICTYYEKLDEYPVQSQAEPGFLRKCLPADAPEDGEKWTVIDNDFHQIIMPGMTHWQSGMFAAYFPGNATFEGCLADLYASAVSNPGFNWICSPAATELELITVDWWAKMIGLGSAFQSYGAGSHGGGVIHGSATEACLSVTIAARERILDELTQAWPMPNGHAPCDGSDPGHDLAVSEWRGGLTSRLVLYATTQTHSIALKAALVLGLSFRALEVKAEDAFGLRGETLRAALEEDKKAGRIPFILVLTIGTTSSGAVDNITEAVEVARDYPSLWLHVDAAYAGVALSLPELRPSSHVDSINARVDSFSTNMHKWGLVQLECSPLHVRDRAALTRALTVTPEFLRTKEGDAGEVQDLRNMQLAVGRRFRSLKLWFVLRSYGIKGFQAHLRHSMACADVFKNAMEEHGAPFEFVAPPRWSLVVFRLNPERKEGSSKELDALNQRFIDCLNTRTAELTLTHTVLPEVGLCVRYVVGSPQVRQDHAVKAFRIVRECAEETLRT